MNRDYVRAVRGVLSVGQAYPAAPKNPPANPKPKNGAVVLQAEAVFFEWNAPGPSFGEDEVSEMDSFGWDHLVV